MKAILGLTLICFLLISQSEGDLGRDARECGPHERYHPCKKHCELTCTDKLPKMCEAICTGGCMCVEGYYRNEKDKCVKREKCKKGGKGPKGQAP